MNPSLFPKPATVADQFLAVDVFAELLASTAPDQVGQRLTEQLRELTGAHTVLLIGHAEGTGEHWLIHACPARRSALFTADELGQFCPQHRAEHLPRQPVDLPPEHPLRALLLRAGVESVLRFPLQAGNELVATVLLLDLPGLDRIDETVRTVTHLSVVIALALKNAFAHERIEQQARSLELQTHELERRVAERTADLEAMNKTLFASRLTALKLMEDAVAARDTIAQSAAALRASEERFRRAVVASPFPMMLHAEDGQILQVSNSWCEITGYAHAELATIGDWTERAFGERKALVQADIGRLYGLDRRLSEGDYTLRTKAGSTRIWEFSSAPLGALQDGRRVVISMAMDVTERRQAEETLRQSEERLADITFSMADWVWEVDAQGVYTYSSQKGSDLLGRVPEEIVGKTPFDFMPPAEARRVGPIFSELAANKALIKDLENWNLTRDGESICLLTNGVPILDAAGNLRGYRGVDKDITERKRAEAEKSALEAQLREAQKLQSVGQLAGGVAHDFNNLLMGMMNYVELCRDGLPPEHPIRGYLDEITHDAQRSANITQQLLAFARKQIIAPRVLDLNDALAGTLRMLRHLMGEDIALTWEPAPALWPVRIDPSQLDQVLANLCINARDAIAGVGRVAIQTANTTLDEAYCTAHADVAPGEYVRLAVSDSGCGMSADVLAHIFEPFFTTKEVGKGTGLGLATVYGIIKQNAGQIEVCSEPGKGTTFSIYLPRAAAAADTGALAVTPQELPRGTETILLVEDEKSVRVTSGLFLKQLGYTVMVAETPEEALRVAGAHSGPIHLLVTDVIMPGMNGPDLAGFLTGECPNLKCLFMSGYTADVIMQRGTLNGGMQFLSKPFSRHDLARKVREVLDTH